MVEFLHNGDLLSNQVEGIFGFHVTELPPVVDPSTLAMRIGVRSRATRSFEDIGLSSSPQPCL